MSTRQSKVLTFSLSVALAGCLVFLFSTLPRAQATSVTWTVTSSSDDENDGNVVSHTGSLRFALTHASSGDVVGFNLVGVDKIYVASTLTVPQGVSVGYRRDQDCGSYAHPRAAVDALNASIDPVFSLGANSTLRNIDIGGGRISVRVTGGNVDVCGSGLGIEYDGDGNLVPLPPAALALSIDGDHAMIHRNYLNGQVAISVNGSDSRLGDTVNGSGDTDDGVRNAAITVLAGATQAAQRVTIRDPFPRSLFNLIGNGIAGGDDAPNHANNWAQTPTIISAHTPDNFATVQVHGSANPSSLVDIYFDDQISVTRQTPVLADASGAFTFTGSVPGSNVKVIAVSTLIDPAHAGRVGSSSKLSDPVSVSTIPPMHGLQLTPSTLTFSAVLGGSIPPTQTLLVAAPTVSPTLSWHTEVTTTDGFGWLSAMPGAANGDGSIGVTVNPIGLTPGTYHGMLTIVDSGQPTDRSSSGITLIVEPPPSIHLSPSDLTFTATVGGASPSAQSLTVQTPFDSPLIAWQTAMTETEGSGWLQIDPLSGQGDGLLTVTVSSGALPSGVYHGVITVRETMTPTSVATATIALKVFNVVWLPLIMR